MRRSNRIPGIGGRTGRPWASTLAFRALRTSCRSSQGSHVRDPPLMSCQPSVLLQTQPVANRERFRATASTLVVFAVNRGKRWDVDESGSTYPQTAQRRPADLRAGARSDFGLHPASGVSPCDWTVEAEYRTWRAPGTDPTTDPTTAGGRGARSRPWRFKTARWLRMC